MKQPEIIVIINGQSYRLCASDIESIHNISDIDRKQLITLLGVVKGVDSAKQGSSQQVAAKVSTSSQSKAPAFSTDITSDNQGKSPERLRSGDADAVMAQLIMEDDLNKKPALTKHTIHKAIAITAVVIILLILIF